MQRPLIHTIPIPLRIKDLSFVLGCCSHGTCLQQYNHGPSAGWAVEDMQAAIGLEGPHTKSFEVSRHDSFAQEQREWARLPPGSISLRSLTTSKFMMCIPQTKPVMETPRYEAQVSSPSNHFCGKNSPLSLPF